MAFEVGERIGDYEVVAILGAGGMGQVYKVQNVISKRVEAMKVLLPNLESDPSLAERFMQEIQVQASLDHPNIAALHTAQRVGNQLVMVMEYVEGTTVDGLLKDGPLPVPRALDYSVQVLSALSYAHAQGVVHRDIKPANMMLTPAGTVKLMDFGIAKMADRQLTRTGHTVGSLFYMSPEQINNPHALDARSDLYSLGISMYEMVTGRRPFLGDSDYSIMLGHLARPAEPPIAIDPRLPQELSDVILMAIAKDMEKRFQSADAMKRALESISAGLPHEPALAVRAASAAPPPPVLNTVPIGPPPGAVRAVTPAGPPPVPPPIPQAAPLASRRGLYLALGSVATVLVLALAAWQGPKLFRSSAAAPEAQTELPQPPVQQPAATAPAEPPSVATQEPPAVASPQVAAPSPAAQPPAAVVKPAHQAASAPKPGVSAQPAAVVPEPPQTQAPAAQQAQTQPPAAPAPDAAALREVRKQLMMLATRAKTLNSTVDQLKSEQARMGLGLRGDIVNAQHRMEMFLDEAEAEMRSGDVEEAKKNLESADREIEKLEKFLGR